MLQTKRLLLREWCEEDLPSFAAMNADPRVMKTLPRILTRAESDELARRIRADMNERGFELWAVELVGTAPFIGFVGLSVPRFEAHFTPCVEIGWRIAAEHWNQGYATEAAEAVVKYGFEEKNLEEIVAITAVGNVASRRVMEKLGMKHDPAEDFNHPRLEPEHPLCRHVLYRLQNET